MRRILKWITGIYASLGQWLHLILEEYESINRLSDVALPDKSFRSLLVILESS